MRTLRLVVRAPDPDDDAVVEAARVLRDEGLVAFPTETVYGLGARADRSLAVRKIFAAKGRPAKNPLIVHFGDVDRALDFVGAQNKTARLLAERFWPGPLTLVVPRPAQGIADEVVAGGASVAVRVPAHPVAQALLRAVALPIAAPSANRSTQISSTNAEHVLKSLAGRIDICLDGGQTGLGLESTIVDTRHAPAVLLRLGAIPRAALEALVELVDASANIADPAQIAVAPGGQLRHYAPRATLLVVPEEALRDTVSSLQRRGLQVGVMRSAEDDGAGEPLVEHLGADAATYASRLYAALHRLDDRGVDAIVVAEPPPDPAWDALRDRLRRASA